ncbi:MAG TPA: phytanoyl-CoA dioxygenase family protein, partial [Burkholderiaceae bacterium]|nr:phytanoyl-CoA dioxygenase family protein [Burkholderiaceae bacterium]
EPASVVGFWFAIEDAHRGNGCLGALVGQHRRGLKEVFRRQSDGRLALEPQHPAPHWDMSPPGRPEGEYRNAQHEGTPMSALEWIEVRQGALVVFDGGLPHLSEANRSAQSRHAYTLHAVDGRAHYPASNWIQRREGVDPPWRGFG